MRQLFDASNKQLLTNLERCFEKVLVIVGIIITF